MCPTELPGERWSQLAIDVCGPFPTGEYIVVVTDNYCRWPKAKILKTVTSASILKWLNKVFAQHGYPHVLKSDNASYFTSEEFKSTLNSWGIQLRTVTEYWPQANGEVERFNEVIKKHVLTSQAEQKDWLATLPNLLLQYRTTPHRMTGQTPAKLLLQREMRTKIPTIQPAKVKDGSRMDAEVRNKDSSEKAKTKEYTDKTRHAKTRNLAVGDEVLVTQKRKNKYSTQFGKDPMKIIKINGSQIILEDRHGKQHRRNSSHVKKYLKKNPTPSADDEDSTSTNPIPPAENQPETTNPPATDPTGNEANIQNQTGTNNNQPQEETTRRSSRQKTAPDYVGFDK
jgi:hypothetical protein